jgi:hypothetical protein
MIVNMVSKTRKRENNASMKPVKADNKTRIIKAEAASHMLFLLFGFPKDGGMVSGLL